MRTEGTEQDVVEKMITMIAVLGRCAVMLASTGILTYSKSFIVFITLS